MSGRLFLCSTPIGNLADASPRLAETLAASDVVFAEDTRRSAKLLSALGVSADLRSYFIGNERSRNEQLEALLEQGRTVAVITDAGAPAVSDPGASAVGAARTAGAEVVVVPGPSAVTAAVTASGMVDGPFVFEGFLARSGSERTSQLRTVCGETKPVVLFLSPHRVERDLNDLAAVCGEGREVCVGRELTKLHEEVWWGSLGEAVERWGSEPARGEFTLVLEGAAAVGNSVDDAVAVAHRLMEGGTTASRAARQAAELTQVSRREVYERLIREDGG